MKRTINVLSLCDGMSCGRIALERAEIPVGTYYASEIKPHAIKVSRHNYSDIIQIGDVTRVKYSDGYLETEKGRFKTDIDLVIFGSPCQSFSIAMKTDKRVGLDNMEKSGLFWECFRILKEINPKYFLMENVASMKDEDRNLISRFMGVEAIMIDSALVSAQMRKRYYWTNIPNVTQPEDKGIMLSDILSDGWTEKKKARCLMANDSHGYFNGCNWNAPARFHREYNKAFSTMIYPSKEAFEKCVDKSVELLAGRKPKAEYYNTYEGHEFDCMRYFWKEERARLQTVPEGYVDILTEKESADVLGDGWTVDVIAHIFKAMKGDY